MPTLPDDFEPHPARDASLASMRAVEAGDKVAWLRSMTKLTWLGPITLS